MPNILKFIFGVGDTLNVKYELGCKGRFMNLLERIKCCDKFADVQHILGNTVESLIILMYVRSNILNKYIIGNFVFSGKGTSGGKYGDASVTTSSLKGKPQNTNGFPPWSQLYKTVVKVNHD